MSSIVLVVLMLVTETSTNLRMNISFVRFAVKMSVHGGMRRRIDP